MNNKVSNVFIRIGLPKTGSTYFQNYVFPKLNEYGKVIYNNPIFLEMKELIDDIIKKKISLEDNNVTLFKQKLNTFLQSNADKIILCSNENLSNNGGTIGFYYEKGIELLHHFIPQAKIILFLRKHDDWIVSIYKQSILIGNFQTFDQFVYFDDQKKNNTNTYETGLLPKLNIKKIKYKKFINYLEGFFLKENIFVFDYDEFKQDNIKFVNKVTKLICGEQINLTIEKNKKIYRSLSGFSIIIILFLSKIFKPFLKSIYYNDSRKLIYSDDFKNNDKNLKKSFYKKFTWVKVRRIFNEYLDEIVYIDLSLTKKLKKKLKIYKNFFDSDKYDQINFQ
tara:strand:- start:195 stop:1202 length:1008 start_codon:yes stop_codon:yes gene_type:complete